MIFTGLLLGPFVFNLIDTSILEISSQLRRIALIIILTRAGLSLNVQDLKKVGRPALLLCFLPACFEIAGMALMAPFLLGNQVSLKEALLMGSVVAAVSPAVVVPKMIRIIEERRGTKKSIPQMILAGASVDDVFVIVLFSVFLSLNQGSGVDMLSFVQIPFSIILGIIAGVLLGFVISIYFSKFHMRDSVKVMVLFCVAFFLVSFEDAYGKVVPFASLISVMVVGITLNQKMPRVAVRLGQKYNRLWVCAEILLFVLVGATVNPSYVKNSGVVLVVLVLSVLLFRSVGVLLCTVKTSLNFRERIFCMVSYLPKATVQAAIGGIALSLGLDCGNVVLTLAVLSICITAPLGAFLIELSYKKLLTLDEDLEI